ncbi:hypothetical protein BDV98DRAFT_415779 [Pterulicium gracile]|uniref:Uncharacterized protein n=1 Tax=Pterulicium gracile TaxID=1884261 RepID=A0A5C3QRF3_9AGAR|nr:hypothetical protein BDV98DRAFT_415779 [Pterula gracilis]
MRPAPFDVNTIPVDAWIEIFRSCQDDEAEFHRILEGPWLVSHVCRGWSSICRSTPSLWSTIRFTTADKRTPDSLLSLLERRLVYAASLPLKIHIEGERSSECEKAVLIMHLLLPRHAQTVKALRFFFPPITAMSSRDSARNSISTFTSQATSRFPLLETLDIHGALHPTHLKLLLSAFPHYPSLRSLSLPHLTYAQPSDPTIEEVHTLTQLTRLEWSNWSNEGLDYLCAPILESLSLGNCSGVSHVATFIARSGCTIRQLALNSVFYSEDLIRVLQCIPNLSHLALHHIDSQRFSDMISSLHPGSVCPTLQSLSLSESPLRIEHQPINTNQAVGDAWTSSEAREALLLLFARIVNVLELRRGGNGTEKDHSFGFARVYLNAGHSIAHRAMDIDPEMQALARRVEHLADEGLDVDVCWRVSVDYRPSKRTTSKNGILFRSFLFDAANPILEKETLEASRSQWAGQSMAFLNGLEEEGGSSMCRLVRERCRVLTRAEVASLIFVLLAFSLGWLIH